MAAYKSNRLLIIGVVIFGISSSIVAIYTHHGEPSAPAAREKLAPHPVVRNTASQDSAAESLDTLTVQWTTTEQQVKSIVEHNTQLQQENKTLWQQLQNKTDQSTNSLTTTIAQLQSQIQALTAHSTTGHSETTEAPQPIERVPELAELLQAHDAQHLTAAAGNIEKNQASLQPRYTIPANATAVQNRLMTALVGRIPVKGIVTDPYPFKIVFSDDTLAANGYRVPHLRQMIVSGYTEGDLNLMSVRGWVTSLTFVFRDGVISTTTSNDNNIGRYTKENALGYLSDATGNPFIRGKLITNAPMYIGTNIALGAAQGAANAYAQSQTTAGTTSLGTAISTVTGSTGAFIAGQSASNGMSQVQQWWHDREEQSFDAVYVPTVDPHTHQYQTVVVNFTKEIHIDYDLHGRKIDYVQKNNPAADSLD
jgi:regulator of replication initiation timing